MRNGTLTGKTIVQGLLGLALAAGVAFVPAQQASAAEQRGGQGQLSIALEAQADTASRSDGVDTYKVVVVNRGGGEVKKVDVALPFGAGYALAEASFTQEDAWVTQKDNGVVNVRIEQLRGQDDTMIGTLRFHGPRDAAANAVKSAATVAWKLDGKAYSLPSNQPAGANVVTAATVEARVVSFSGTGFVPGEPVTFWYTAANGVSTPLVRDGAKLLVEPADKHNDDDEDEKRYGAFLPANAQGAVVVSFDTAGLPNGAYTLAARGNWSGAVASMAFAAR